MSATRFVVSLPEEELDRIYRVCKPDYRRIWAERGWQAIFSCNNSYEIWPTKGLGKTPLDARDHLDLADFPHLWQIVTEVLKVSSIGGRVFVKDDRFFVKTNGPEEELDVGVIRRRVSAPVSRPRTRRIGGGSRGML